MALDFQSLGHTAQWAGPSPRAANPRAWSCRILGQSRWVMKSRDHHQARSRSGVGHEATAARGCAVTWPRITFASNLATRFNLSAPWRGVFINIPTGTSAFRQGLPRTLRPSRGSPRRSVATAGPRCAANWQWATDAQPPKLCALGRRQEARRPAGWRFGPPGRGMQRRGIDARKRPELRAVPKASKV
jgi:hypothetical protein